MRGSGRSAGEGCPVSRHELRVFGVGDGVRPDAELVDIRPVARTLILVALLVAHDEFARGDSRDLQQ